MSFEKSDLGGDVIFKGRLLKRNWYNNKQLRHFELSSNGLLKYYALGPKEKLCYKSCLVLTPDTQVSFNKAQSVMNIT
jgi:hypothetical protein